MAQLPMRRRANRITYFVTVQTIALLGWIIVQSSFSLSPIGKSIPFAVTMIIEAIWWAATLVIMFVLFRREYNSFVQAVLDLEDANHRLRERTTNMLMELSKQEPLTPQAEAEETPRSAPQPQAEEASQSHEEPQPQTEEAPISQAEPEPQPQAEKASQSE